MSKNWQEEGNQEGEKLVHDGQFEGCGTAVRTYCSSFFYDVSVFATIDAATERQMNLRCTPENLLWCE